MLVLDSALFLAPGSPSCPTARPHLIIAFVLVRSLAHVLCVQSCTLFCTGGKVHGSLQHLALGEGCTWGSIWPLGKVALGEGLWLFAASGFGKGCTWEVHTHVQHLALHM
eukprot:scaffold451_cov21-Tisochrysis_lutea.AAC.2